MTPRALIRAVATILFIASATSACGQQAAPPEQGQSPAVCAPQPAAPRGGCLPQGFQISGELTGTVADAFVEQRCQPPILGQGLGITTMDFRLGGHSYQLALDTGTAIFFERPLTLTQAGSAVLARLAITDSSGAGSLGAWESTGGSILVGATGTGGALKLALLAQNTSGARPLRLEGAWRCGRSAANPSPTSSSCSSLLSAAHPEGVDTAELAAAPCKAVSLDLSGALSGHADLAAVVAPATDLQPSCNQTPQGLHTQLEVPLAGRIVTVVVWLRREPIRGALGAGDYPDPGYVDGIDPAPVVASAGRLSWSYKSGHVSLDPGLAGGTVDADLQGGTPNFGETVHISGTWRCA